MAVLECLAARIHQEHDRGFQPLGRMHGHDPHRTGLAFHLALDFRRIGFKHGKKRLQTGKARLLVIERQAKKLVEHIADFMAETER
jgi:hypothetical protein